jgi:uncharacterized protein
VGCAPHVVDHCINVTEIAMKISNLLEEKKYEVNRDLVEIGGLLHDIGRSETHDVNHSAVGGRIARSLGLPDEIVRIVERHIGAGIPKWEAEELGLPEGIYIPITLEEKIVAYADKLICGDKVVDISITIEDFAEDLGWDHPAIKRLQDLHGEFVEMLGPDFTKQF